MGPGEAVCDRNRPGLGDGGRAESNTSGLKAGGWSWLGVRVVLPYKVSTLLYCFNEADEVLLMERTRPPNVGLWSPCGGKVMMEQGESPYAAACREAEEEAGLRLQASDLHLTAIVSESGYLGQAHWLMFLFEVKPRLRELPPPHAEGRFEFVARADFGKRLMPRTDVEQIWPLFWEHRGGFFAAHCRSIPEGVDEWVLEESRPGAKL